MVDPALTATESDFEPLVVAEEFEASFGFEELFLIAPAFEFPTSGTTWPEPAPIWPELIWPEPLRPPKILTYK